MQQNESRKLSLAMDIIDELKKEGLKLPEEALTESAIGTTGEISLRGSLHGNDVKLVIELDDLISYYTDCFSGNDGLPNEGHSDDRSWHTIMGTHAYETAWKVSEYKAPRSLDLVIRADKHGLYLDDEDF